MFGYVNIYKDELKVRDYNRYRSFYCGLCKTLGKEFSQRTRMSLNYDFTFLALVLSSVSDEKMKTENESCIIHPSNKRPVLKDDDFLSYAAFMSVIVTYFKLKDDVNDIKSLKSIIGLLLFKKHLRKAKKKYPDEFDKIKELLLKLNKLEVEKTSDIDEVSDPFGEVLKILFTPSQLACDNATKRALADFGYSLGRFIYIIDALDDIEKDIKKKNYNPFLIKYDYKGEDAAEFKNKFKDEYDMIITLTLERIASAFELMDFKKNREIVENVVYLGLRRTKDKVLGGK